MKNKILFVLLSVVACILLCIWLVSSPVTYTELECYEEYNEETKHVKKVFLVNSLPYFLSSFEEATLRELDMIQNADSVHSLNVYFVKETSHNLLNRYLWGDDEKYSKCTADLNSIDFLARAHYFKSETGHDTMKVKFYSGDLYHY